MKNVSFITPLLAFVFLLFTCNPSSETASDTDKKVDVVATDDTATTTETSSQGQIVGKSAPAAKSDIVPPKHTTKEELVTFIIDKANASSVPFTAAQEESVRAIAERYSTSTFSDMVIYRKIKKAIIKAIKEEVLTEEQLKAFPEKKSKKEQK